MYETERCSDLQLTYTLDDRCKPRIEVSKEVLPIVWFGEKTPPRLYGWGRLVKVKFADGSKRNFVERLVILEENITEIPKNRKVIVIGGVDPIVFIPKYIVWSVRHVVESEKLNLDFADLGDVANVLVPAGIGYKTYAILGTKGHTDMLTGFTGEMELYNPPECYWVKVENGEVTDVKALKI